MELSYAAAQGTGRRARPKLRLEYGAVPIITLAQRTLCHHSPLSIVI
jgi:hypothetical protein